MTAATELARRVYVTADGRRLAVVLCSPTPDPSGRSVYCELSVLDAGTGATLLSDRAHGLDAFQAIQLVFRAMRLALEKLDMALRWEGGEAPDDLGLYMQVDSYRDAAATKQLEALLKRSVDALHSSRTDPTKPK